MIIDSEKNVCYPVGDLGIIGMRGCEEISQKIDNYLLEWRGFLGEDGSVKNDSLKTFQIETVCPRFGTGEAKGIIKQSVRGHDLFIICNVFNYGIKYKMYNQDVPISPDDHFQDLKRIISATAGKARRTTVIMPMLYEGRQHKRAGRESLDCALALQELTNMGVENIITFDAHDPRVHNAIPLKGFENFNPAYQMIKAITKTVKDFRFNHDTMIVSPDEGGMGRCIYYSTLLGLELGMFYKRRDYSVIINGRNPIVSHEFLGDNVEGKDVIIVDDMISSGDSILDICKQLKVLKARRIFIFATFGLFCEGLREFDKSYSEKLFDRIFTTNLIYRTPELKSKQWYKEVDMSKYIAYIINTINFDSSLSDLVDPAIRIKNYLATRAYKE